ncbi:MAG: hypothetical protein JSV10_01640 [Candidatus Zixiibacteriota bacterium]|nr:MAG: hypothetical protein JSV10_01640 [candidate division Zixibacteria bacterium]
MSKILIRMWCLGNTSLKFCGILTAFSMVCLTATPVAAVEGEETLFKAELEHTGFFAVVAKMGPVVGQTELMGGFRAGWIIDHTLAIGGGIYILTEAPLAREIGPGRREDLDYRYMGLEVEYIHNSSKQTHLSFYTLVGGGDVKYEKHVFYLDGSERDQFFITEPGMNVIFNVTKFFRIGIGGSYRFTGDVELRGLSNSDMDGFSANLTLKVGKF